MAINRLWSNVLRSLLALFGLNVFTACYGPAPYSPYVSVWGKVVDEQDRPVSGIEVSCTDNPSSPRQTSTDGFFEYSVGCSAENVPQKLTLKFTDVDGPDNGGEFEEKTVTVILEDQAREPEPMVIRLNLKK